MPAGLDGHSNPIETAQRTAVLHEIAVEVEAVERDRVVVGIDGRPGAGKSTFADELAAVLGASGFCTVRSTTDSFHRPRAERMRQGPTSAVGYVDDSHQIGAIVNDLLLPFRDGASSVRVAAFDEPSDEAIDERVELDGPAVLVFDGLFLQRPELVDFWDRVILLDADRRVDASWLDFLLGDLPTDSSDRARVIDERLRRARWPRYRDGWQRYVGQAAPFERAIVIDDNDLERPSIVR